MAKTSIEWTDQVWNPTAGCTRCSEGCRNCYAFDLHDRRHAAYQAGKSVPAQYARPFKELQLIEDRLEDPLHWRQPRRVFVNSMSDLFHEDVPDEYLHRVFEVMENCQRHTYQVLTKRAERLARYVGWRWGKGRIPCRNIWLGVSVEDQERADERIPLLLRTPAAVRFLSCEPLLSALDLSKWMACSCPADYARWPGDDPHNYWCPRSRSSERVLPKLGWIIVGGESGPHARPMHPRWAQSLRDQCQAASVPFFFKQWGAWQLDCRPTDADEVVQAVLRNPDGRWVGPNGETTHTGWDAVYMTRVGKKAAGRLLDGKEWDEFPEVTRGD